MTNFFFVGKCYLSRHPVITNNTNTSGIKAEHHVNLITSAAVPLGLKSDDIIDATKNIAL